MREALASQRDSASEAVLLEIPHPRSDFRPDIEGMRAVAILMVVAFHAGFAWIRGGFIGVDVFFVLSGYLITDILVKEIERTGRLSFAKFYARRAKRLLPASFLLVLCTLLFSFAILSPLEVTRIAQTAMATGSYSSNLWFILKSTDYFGAGVDTNPLLHTWSLAVEEQFYLVWPLLLLLCLKQRKTRAIAAVVLSIVALISFAACIWLTRMYAPIAFFSTPTRTWEFAIGGLAAMLQETQRLRALRHVKFAWLGTVLLLGSACLMRSTSRFPGPMALIPGVGTVLILIAGKYCAMDSGLFGALKHPAMQKIGNLSYSWYLWHWPILVFGRILLPSSGKLGSTLLLAISLCIAWLSYRLVETPIRFSPRLSVVPSSALALGAGLTAAGLLVSGLALAGAHRWEHYPPEMAFLKASSGSAQDDHCATGFRSDALIRCSFGPVDGPVVVLFGNSHAGQWIPALRDLPVPRWHVITLLKSACPSVDVPVYNPHLQREDNNCSRWRQKALDYIRRIRPVAVILCNSSGYVKRPDFEDPYAHVTVSTWQAGMRSTLTNMNTGATSVFLVRDTPRPGFDVPTCLSRAESHPGFFSASGCTIREATALAEPVWRAERLAAAGLSYVLPVDLTNRFCGEGQCKPIMYNMIVYRDGNHMTLAFHIPSDLC